MTNSNAQTDPAPSDAPVKALVWKGLGHGEAIAVAVVALALLLAYNWLAYIWLDLIDEGYFLEQASRVLHGQLPYRDFDTYYTPAVVYLHAFTFWITGEQSVIPVRLVLAVVRTLIAVLLYVLARPLSPPPIAVIPALVVMAVDPLPVMWEPHPGTYANLTSLVVLWSMALFLERPRLWTLAVAGVFAGITFAFKQNIGVFAVFSVCGFLALHERPRLPGWLTGPGRTAVALGICFAFTALLLNSLDPLYFIVFLIPLFTVCGLMLIDSFRKSSASVSSAEFIQHQAVFLGAFGLTTLLWILPLVMALGVRGTPWNLFVGRVNTTALIFPLLPPSPIFPVVVIGLGTVLLALAVHRPYGIERWCW